MPANPAAKPLTACLLFSLIFVAVLLAPVLGSALGVKGSPAKTHTKATPPVLDPHAFLDPEYFQAWTHFADTVLTADHTLTRAKSWIDYHLFAMTDVQGVYVGRSGWLFDRPSIEDARKNACSRRSRIQQLVQDLEATARIAEVSGRRLIFSVAPNKATIYPEFLGDLPPDPDCRQSLYDLLLAEHRRRPIKGFVPLDQPLRDAKNDFRLIYDPAGTYWNADGAAAAARTLLERLFPNGSPTQSPDADLGDRLLQRQPDGPAAEPPVPGRRLSAVVVYSGPAISRILPYITPRFERVDLIAATTIPSANHHEDLAGYETILVMVTEPQLADLHLDMDGLCRMLDVDGAATSKTQIPLTVIRAEKEVSLDLEGERLLIKSMGAGSFFKLPALPGSDDDTLRLLSLDLTAPQGDTLTWSSEAASAPIGSRTLRSGPGRLYLPLPRGKSLQLRINAGRNAGIFELRNAALLSFSYQSDGRQAAAYAIEPPPAIEAPAGITAQPTVETEPVITLNDFEARRIFQRRGTACDITVSGSYQGRPEAIEAQITRYDSREVVMPWTVVDGSPANGIFIGVVAGVPQGGWYRLAVRFRDRHTVKAQGQSPWAVGLLAAFIGQSNMREWFYAGDTIKTHDLVSVHSDGAWQQAQNLGNGASAFANRLIVFLGIPVGLLDYAVNGSGLRHEADWGTGYWADRGPGGIYERFVQGVNAAGGAVEYVIWMQGEADAARKTITETQYRHTLKEFIIRQVRKDIVNGSHLANLPFLVVGMPKRPVGQDQPHQAIRNALRAVTREVDDCHLAAVAMDLTNQGHQHLTPEAYADLGRRAAQTVLYLQGKVDYYRGPSATQVHRDSNSTIDVNVFHRGGNDFTPARGITGFQVFGPDGAAVPLERVERLAPSTIRIHLQQAAPGALQVAYLYGAMPDSQGAVHDNSALELPLEPFEMAVE